jgi:hypothetical protein
LYDKVLAGRPVGQKVNILAHSFGGLVTRSFIQDGSDQTTVNRIVTLGTPHRGSSNIYPLWEGVGTAPTGDPLFRTGIWALAQVYAHPHTAWLDMQAFRNKFPGLQDMLPVYDSYIFPSSFAPTSTSQLKFKSKALTESFPLSQLVATLDKKGIAFTSIYATGVNSLRNIDVFPPISNAKVWEDGKPFNYRLTQGGDDSVLTESAHIDGVENIEIKGHHFDIPNNSVKYLSTLFKLNNDSVVPYPELKNMVTLLVLSPASPELYDSSNNLISTKEYWAAPDVHVAYAKNLEPDIYTAKIVGTGTGSYTFASGYAGDTVWSENQVSGSTKAGKVDSYQFILDNVHNQPFSLIVPTKLQLRADIPELFKGKLALRFVLDLPKNFDATQLNLKHVWLNDTYLPTVDSQINKNNVIVALKLKDIANIVNWNDREFEFKVLAGGTNQSLQGTKKFKIPWGLYKKQLDRE